MSDVTEPDANYVEALLPDGCLEAVGRVIVLGGWSRGKSRTARCP
jgi:hypothetical protein